MPANHKVSVGWQIVFTFITGLNFWAFYRIRKLRKYVLYIIVPSVALSIASYSYPRQQFSLLGDNGLAFGDPSEALVVSIITTVIGLGIQGFSIYLVIIWSRAHNRAFESPSQSHL